MEQTLSQFIASLRKADERQLKAFFDENLETVGAVLFPESSREWRNYIGNLSSTKLRDMYVEKLRKDFPDVTDLEEKKQSTIPAVLGFLKRHWLATTGYGLVGVAAVATWMSHQELVTDIGTSERDRIQEIIDNLPMLAVPKLYHVIPNGVCTPEPLPSQFSFSDEFNAPVLMGLPPTPNADVMQSYAFDVDNDIQLNPYLIIALEESADAREYLRLIKNAAEAHGIGWRMAANQIFRESHHFNSNIVDGKEVSARGAIGIAQFTEDTAFEKFGLTRDDLLDPKTSIEAYAQHMRNLLDGYNNDNILALMAYNAGPGAVDWAREELENPNATGQEVLDFLTDRHAELGNDAPHAYHVETRKYINSILGLSDDEIDPSWQLQQNEKLNNPLFIAGLENENYVLSVAYPTYIYEETPAPITSSSPHAPETSLRPRSRPPELEALILALNRT